MRYRQLAILAITAGGCGLADEPAESTVQSEIACGMLLCGTNAPSAGDGLLFDELDLFGRPNYAGVAMTGANLESGPPVKIQIWHDILYATDSSSRLYIGPSLVGIQIHFKHIPSGETFDLRIDDFNPQATTFMSGARDVIPAYDFKARRAGSTQFDYEVCNHDGLPVATEESWPGLPHHALVYRGDRYGNHKNVVPNSPSDGWSFIACNGGAATKMHMWRHTYAGAFDTAGNPTYMTTPQERQTLLKAITADYCGDAVHEYTAFGQPLAFATADEPGGFPTPYTAVSSVEALWGPSGVLCLDRPRRLFFGVTKPQVEKDCGRMIPSCGTLSAPTAPPPGWFNSSHVITANP